MYRLYEDLRTRLGEPLWHDEQGVPRYEPFHPSMCGIYDSHVALLEIACQSCGQRFLVSDSWNHTSDFQMQRWWEQFGKVAGKPKPEFGKPDLPTADNFGGAFSFGDAPWHGEEQCAGTTMTTGVTRVVEFWEREGPGGRGRRADRERPCVGCPADAQGCPRKERKMRYEAVVTFEFPQQAPETWRGSVSATGPHTAVSRAVQAAKRQYPKRKPSSLVVLLEPQRVADAA